jgi:phosphoadenosine phosphosulfate reductase
MTIMSLEEVAGRVGPELEDATAHEIVEWAAGAFGERLCVTSSMSDAVVVHLVSTVVPGVDVLFLDTGYHFAETIGTRDAVAAVYNVRIVTLRPAQTVAGQDAEHGPRLYNRDPDQCCALRKVAPLERALTGYDAWVTGLRRDESPSRAGTPVVAWDARRGKVKVNPIARWTQADVDAYIDKHGILVNPLLYDGYASVGCAPCTRRPLDGEGTRAGRWAGRSKTECGLHV